MPAAAPPAALTHLDVLESESIHIIREVAAELERPVLMFSGGKDSIVMLRLAERAFAPARIPFGLLQVDTGYDFPEVLATRDRWVERLGIELHVASVEQAIADGGDEPVPTHPPDTGLLGRRHGSSLRLVWRSSTDGASVAERCPGPVPAGCRVYDTVTCGRPAPGARRDDLADPGRQSAGESRRPRRYRP